MRFSSNLICLAVAGVGGILPTLSKIAASFVAQPEQPMPHWHILIAIMIFFLLGSALNIPFNKEGDSAKALVVGIAAPALITNIIAGVASAPPPPIAAIHTSLHWFVGSAFAQEHPTSSNYHKVEQRNVTFYWHIEGYQNFNRAGSELQISVDNDPSIVMGGSVGYVPPFSVPDGASNLLIRTNGGMSYKVPIQPGAGPIAIDATALIVTTPSQDLSWAFGANRDGSPIRLKFTVRGAA